MREKILSGKFTASSPSEDFMAVRRGGGLKLKNLKADL